MITACHDAIPLMSDYLEDLLGSPSKLALEGHLAICPRCCEVLASLRIVPDLVRRSTDVDAPDDLAERIIGRVRTKPS